MSTRVRCSCGHQFAVDTSASGRPECPECGRTITLKKRRKESPPEESAPRKKTKKVKREADLEEALALDHQGLSSQERKRAQKLPKGWKTVRNGFNLAARAAVMLQLLAYLLAANLAALGVAYGLNYTRIRMARSNIGGKAIIWFVLLVAALMVLVLLKLALDNAPHRRLQILGLTGLTSALGWYIRKSGVNIVVVSVSLTMAGVYLCMIAGLVSSVLIALAPRDSEFKWFALFSALLLAFATAALTYLGYLAGTHRDSLLQPLQIEGFTLALSAAIGCAAGGLIALTLVMKVLFQRYNHPMMIEIAKRNLAAVAIIGIAGIALPFLISAGILKGVSAGVAGFVLLSGAALNTGMLADLMTSARNDLDPASNN